MALVAQALPVASAPACRPGGWRLARAPVRLMHACAAPALPSPVPQSAASGVGLRSVVSGQTTSPLQHGQRNLRRPRPSTPAALPELLATLAASPNRDLYVVAGAAVGAAAWVKVFDLLAANGTLEQKLSRKLVHTSTGPLFVITWAMFSAAPSARFLAAVVPMLNFARLFAVGTGLVSDPGLVQSVSRSGDRTELLKGPLFYVVTLVAATVLCWRDNPAGLIAVAMMCGGDGLADIVGRRWGGAKLPYNPSKSWAGSIAMLLGGWGMSYGLITLFCSLGFFACYPPAAMLGCLGAVALAATLVESLPINQYVDDNVSVPGVAALLSLLLLPQPADMVATAAAAAASSAGAAGLAVAAAVATGAAVGLPGA